MKENDIFVFWFRIRARGGLMLHVRKLEKWASRLNLSN
jgi:hypothetical protein